MQSTINAYLGDVDSAWNDYNGEELAKLLSFRDIHVFNPRLQLENPESAVEKMLDPQIDEVCILLYWPHPGNKNKGARNYNVPSNLGLNFSFLYRYMQPTSAVVGQLRSKGILLKPTTAKLLWFKILLNCFRPKRMTTGHYP